MIQRVQKAYMRAGNIRSYRKYTQARLANDTEHRHHHGEVLPATALFLSWATGINAFRHVHEALAEQTSIEMPTATDTRPSLRRHSPI